ncbi:hypothetical protein QYM36_018887 [Artemia franciscana]|uniref:C3H1-type domain-containing protein n=1 Tax=Artemia franciscana TaxID=6661 RepID=A0AA88HBX4_ARTSF|nr:hypothetical protein QYM36_018887 [Artemia franciscana]
MRPTIKSVLCCFAVGIFRMFRCFACWIVKKYRQSQGDAKDRADNTILMDQNESTEICASVQDQNQASNVLTGENNELIKTPSKWAPDEGGDETISLPIGFLTVLKETEKEGLTKLPEVSRALEIGEPSEEKAAPVEDIIKAKEDPTDSRSSSEHDEYEGILRDQNQSSNMLTLPISELIKTFAKVDLDGVDDETISLPIGFLTELKETDKEGLTKLPEVSRALEIGEPSEEKSTQVEDIIKAKEDPTDPRPSSEHDENEGILKDQNLSSSILTLPISELIKTPVKVAPDKREEEHNSYFETNERKEKSQRTIEKTVEANSQNDFSRDPKRYLSIRSSEKCNIRFKKPSYERRQVCWFNENSICRNGDRCLYYHKPSLKSSSETMSAVNPAPKARKAEEKNTLYRKTVYEAREHCRFYIQGYCNNRYCHYYHDPSLNTGSSRYTRFGRC